MTAPALGREILIAAGGTGGHTQPAEALARTLLARGEAVSALTDERTDAFRDAAFAGLPRGYVDAASPAGGLIAKGRAAFLLSQGLGQAIQQLRRRRPGCVVAFGSYAAIPVGAAAALLGIPLVLHEQNAVLGRAHRLLAGRATAIATSFPATKALRRRDAPRAYALGNPVSAAIADQAATPYPNGLDSQPLNILILGGSQGARVFGKVVPKALLALPEQFRDRLRIAHQCRPEDLDHVRAAYDGSGLCVETASYFTDVPRRMAEAHLVIARAGASTVAELTAIGRPAILVPFPHAADDHQRANAEALAAAGAAWCMPQEAFNETALANRLESCLTLPQRLRDMAGYARALGAPAAEERLADLVQRVRAGDPAGQGARVAAGTAPAPAQPGDGEVSS